MSLPELIANPSTPGAAAPQALAHLSAAVTTVPAAGAVEQWSVDAAAPAALRGAQGRFRALIDGEIVVVFSSSSGASPWYVVRGQEGTAPATHGNGTALYHLPTAAQLRGLRRGNELRSRLSQDVVREQFNPGPADNPAISIGAGNAASSITGAAWGTGFTVLPNDPRIRVMGAPGPLVQLGASWPDTLKYLSKGGAASKTIANEISYAVTFDVYCSRLEIAAYGQGNFVNVYVNGVKQSVAQLASDGAQHNILLDWTGSTGLALRRIRLELPAGRILMGFYLAATEDMLAPDVQGSPLRMQILGDSWTDGTGTSDGILSFAVQAARMVGIDDIWQAGIGGTGYLQDSSQGSHLAPRLSTDVFPNTPDILVLSYGSDDTLFTTAAVAAEAVADWKSIMATLPDCLLVVLGPYACPIAGGPPSYSVSAPYDTALASAAAGLGVRYISSIAEKWITGTGYVGATNGSGTSDTLIGPDGVHPTQAGHNFMARRLANKLQQFLSSV